MRAADGSASDADYGEFGPGYRTHRRPEPEFASAISAALGDAQTVVNVGAGAGSYEPPDRDVTAVEPSAALRAERPAALAEAIDATAEELPFADDTFGAAMATFAVHQWRHLELGLAQLRRVTRGPVVILTCDPAMLHRFWLTEYAPEVVDAEARRYPAIDRIRAALGGTTEVHGLPIPLRCVDGFNEAYYGRPEMLLDPDARRANSAWGLVGADVHMRFVVSLTRDLADGTWDDAHRALRKASHFDGSLVLVVSRPHGLEQ
ncbi:class I SAM-dependent methyltransferase [Jiangella mangrovi]|uniref:SAM-dependent methyltransferase n=1 Tax=Jiangella mangrovi TaxID=1524084 RepID=A0A7W9LNK0_9ACTN|nr:methyltransferase domain-containing protein [Jiangella mangrovi]MBB5790361.1 SAM-dependent methyltransferase [Jiangella mangrovi]